MKLYKKEMQCQPGSPEHFEVMKMIDGCRKNIGLAENEQLPKKPQIFSARPNIKTAVYELNDIIEELGERIIRLNATIDEVYGNMTDDYDDPLIFFDKNLSKLSSAAKHIEDIAKQDEVWESIEEGMWDDAKKAVSGAAKAVTNKVASDYDRRNKLFNKGKPA